jgi:hypothetical protein
MDGPGVVLDLRGFHMSDNIRCHSPRIGDLTVRT